MTLPQQLQKMVAMIARPVRLRVHAHRRILHRRCDSLLPGGLEREVVDTTARSGSGTAVVGAVSSAGVSLLDGAI